MASSLLRSDPAQVNAKTLEEFIHQRVNNKMINEMISYLTESAAGVVQCDANITLPPAAQSEPMYPSITRTTNRRATRTNGGLLTVHNFVRQLVVATRMTVPTVMSTLIYLRRIKSRLPNVRGQPSTPHRILLGSLILAAKYFNDITFQNKDWVIISTPAHHFGFELTDVNLMERELLSLLDWDLRITEDDLYQVLDHILYAIRADSQTRDIPAKALCQQLQPEGNPRFWHNRALHPNKKRRRRVPRCAERSGRMRSAPMSAAVETPRVPTCATVSRRTAPSKQSVTHHSAGEDHANREWTETGKRWVSSFSFSFSFLFMVPAVDM